MMENTENKPQKHPTMLTGDTVEYLISSPLYLNSSLTLYQCGWENCRPGHSFGPAVRPHYLFHYVLRGTGTFVSCGREYKISPGQGFLICPGDSTVYTADEQTPWDYCWFGFDGYEAETILKRCGLSQNTPVYTDRSSGVLEENLKKLIRLFADGSYNEYAAIGRLYLVFSGMILPDSGHTGSYDKSYADKAVDFIRHNYTYDIHVTDIARHIGIDRTYLYRVFMKVHHMSPQKYLIRFRLDTACHMLRNSRMPVGEIACSCGFGDIPAFYKHFRNCDGCTPAAYRERYMT